METDTDRPEWLAELETKEGKTRGKKANKGNKGEEKEKGEQEDWGKRNQTEGHRGKRKRKPKRIESDTTNMSDREDEQERREEDKEKDQQEETEKKGEEREEEREEREEKDPKDPQGPREGQEMPSRFPKFRKRRLKKRKAQTRLHLLYGANQQKVVVLNPSLVSCFTEIVQARRFPRQATLDLRKELSEIPPLVVECLASLLSQPFMPLPQEAMKRYPFSLARVVIRVFKACNLAKCREILEEIKAALDSISIPREVELLKFPTLSEILNFGWKVLDLPAVWGLTETHRLCSGGIPPDSVTDLISSYPEVDLVPREGTDIWGAWKKNSLCNSLVVRECFYSALCCQQEDYRSHFLLSQASPLSFRGSQAIWNDSVKLVKDRFEDRLRKWTRGLLPDALWEMAGEKTSKNRERKEEKEEDGSGESSQDFEVSEKEREHEAAAHPEDSAEAEAEAETEGGETEMTERETKSEIKLPPETRSPYSDLWNSNSEETEPEEEESAKSLAETDKTAQTALTTQTTQTAQTLVSFPKPSLSPRAIRENKLKARTWQNLFFESLSSSSPSSSWKEEQQEEREEREEREGEAKSRQQSQKRRQRQVPRWPQGVSITGEMMHDLLFCSSEEAESLHLSPCLSLSLIIESPTPYKLARLCQALAARARILGDSEGGVLILDPIEKEREEAREEAREEGRGREGNPTDVITFKLELYFSHLKVRIQVLGTQNSALCVVSNTAWLDYWQSWYNGESLFVLPCAHLAWKTRVTTSSFPLGHRALPQDVLSRALERGWKIGEKTQTAKTRPQSSTATTTWESIPELVPSKTSTMKVTQVLRNHFKRQHAFCSSFPPFLVQRLSAVKWKGEDSVAWPWSNLMFEDGPVHKPESFCYFPGALIFEWSGSGHIEIGFDDVKSLDKILEIVVSERFVIQDPETGQVLYQNKEGKCIRINLDHGKGFDLRKEGFQRLISNVLSLSGSRLWVHSCWKG